MRGGWIVLSIMVSVCSAAAAQEDAAAPLAHEPSYTLTVPVNEVSVMFQATDFHGVPIADLTQGDLRVLDNGKPQRDIVSFNLYRDLPVRAGILIDTSRSVLENLRRNQQISTEYVRRYLNPRIDEAFVMRFDFEPKLIEDWTGNVDALAGAIRAVAADHESRLGGTAIYDAVYTACRDQFSRIQEGPTGNLLLLFSDGLDNASHTRIEESVAMCQQTNTAIFVFSASSKSMFIEGQKTLSDLASETGGRIFFDQAAEAVREDLRSIEANTRSQYRIIYKPSKLRADGAFHRIKLDSPTRGGIITARSGYYATH